MKRNLWLTAIMTVFLLLPAAPAEAQLFRKKKKEEPKTEAPEPRRPSPYQNLFKDKQVETAASDFITVHKVDQKQLYFEIPLRYLGREMLLASTLTQISSPDYGDIGFKAKTPLHVRFTQRNNTIHLCRITASVETDFMQDAVNRSYGDAILFAYPIAAYSPDSTAVVIDITSLFLSQVKPLEFLLDDQTSGSRRTTAQFKKEASALDEIKSFEDNLSVKSIMSYGITVQMMNRKLLDDHPLTAKVTRTLLLLPEEKMQPRISDSRVGIFNTRKMLFSEQLDGSQAYSLAHRWRLIPSDVEAYDRGELVEPEKRIVFYVDSAFLEPWKNRSKRGWKPGIVLSNASALKMPSRRGIFRRMIPISIRTTSNSTAFVSSPRLRPMPWGPRGSTRRPERLSTLRYWFTAMR
ncbi:MAG: DUF5117 domain-containing protein [Rikenellaceae bacterium]|nr:DUF5117 domain-containing protein [Rikenellaceae bacterium]